MPEEQPHHEPAGGPWRAVAGLVVVAVLVAAIYFVMTRLQHAAQLQDCFASGRTNCAPITTTH